jgi:hypothetical protein
VLTSLAACGGGSSGATGGSGSDGSQSPSASTSTQAQAAGGAQGGGSQGGSGGSGGSATTGGLTPAGQHLSFGQEATVAWVPPSIDLKPGAHKGIKLQVTVESIQKGTIGDFKNIQLNATERKSTPYYVTVRIKALTGTRPPGTDDPDITFNAIDDRGQEQSSVTFFGTFPRCNDNTAPKPFVSGKSYQSCLTYLMPGGGAIKSVQWNNGPSKADEASTYFEHPIVWGG